MHGRLDLVMAAALAVRWLHLAATLGPTPERYDPRRSGKLEWQVAALAGLYAAVLALWGWEAIRSWHTPATAADIAGLATLLGGGALRVSGQHALGPAFAWSSAAIPPYLVTTGIYRYLKHPLLLGYGLECGGLLLTVRGWAIARLAIVALLVAALITEAVREERTLASHFGAQWDAFARGKLL